MKFGTMLILLVAIVAGGFAAFMARAIIQRQAVGGADRGTTIVVANQGLDFGMVLSPENVTEIPWSSSTLPEGAFKSSADLLKDGRRVGCRKSKRTSPSSPRASPVRGSADPVEL